MLFYDAVCSEIGLCRHAPRIFLLGAGGWGFYTYEYNYTFHDSITVSWLLVVFNFINLFFEILMC
jgi:hypothetical protein